MDMNGHARGDDVDMIDDGKNGGNIAMPVQITTTNVNGQNFLSTIGGDTEMN